MKGGEECMGYTVLDIKSEYRSLQDNIVEDFYNPLLQITKVYKRAVGFFSSSALIDISNGIIGLVKNNGKIQIIASPRMTSEDISAINEGIKLKEDILNDRLIEAMEPPKDEYESERMNLLVNLIAHGYLEIKIAIVNTNNQIGIYHEKIGILEDIEGNKIAFTGSMNETSNAFNCNCESIDVFKSWEYADEKRVESKNKTFDKMWQDNEMGIEVLEFPEVARRKLFEYRTSDTINYDIDKILKQPNTHMKELPAIENAPYIPEDVEIRPYQNEAIDNWLKEECVGIFDMATGTGKTYTALAAIARMFEQYHKPLAFFIVCPFQHLVNQWVEDIEKFGMKPIICYSASPQKNWFDRLKNACSLMKFGTNKCICIVSTNATFTSDKVQHAIKDIKSKMVLIIDEAHNFGAEHLSKFLHEDIKYRLALSATLERHQDDAGTAKLYDFFKTKCIEYTLKQAIENNMLVPYYYHPIPIDFQEEELEEYISLTVKIAKLLPKSQNQELSKQAKMLLIKRARLVAAAVNKISALKEVISQYKDDNHMLIYCGATTMKDSGYKENIATEEEKKQIDIVIKMLGNDLDMRVSKFTSEEDAKEREVLKQEFDNGDYLQALVAIRCLDEGVNIPSIDKAFILASSTNPKEYVQRRGRVLRKYEGKEVAHIYDFVLCPLQDYSHIEEALASSLRGLVKNEIERMNDFASLALNTSVADEIIFDMKVRFDIVDEGDDEYE